MCSHISPRTDIAKYTKRTNNTRAPCRKRTGSSVPRAEKLGDLTTPDHKGLGEEGECRNKLRYVVIVQDWATQRVHAYPWITKTLLESVKESSKHFAR